MAARDPFTTLDKSVLRVRKGFDDPDEVAFWHSQPEVARMRHVERLRRMNYGHRATSRLQRILETARR